MTRRDLSRLLAALLLLAGACDVSDDDPATSTEGGGSANASDGPGGGAGEGGRDGDADERERLDLDSDAGASLTTGEDGSQDTTAGGDAGMDASSGAGGDAGSTTGDAGEDAGQDAGEDAGQDAGEDAGQDAGEDAGEDAGQDAGEDAGGPPPAPDRVDCSAVPTNTTCEGGPNEVILLAHTRGRIAAIDPEDGTYLGHIAEDTLQSEGLHLNAVQATQGPDNCIYVLKDDNLSDYAIRRLDTDGTVVDEIIDFVDVNGTEQLSRTPTALQFHDGTLYIASEVSSIDPTPPPSLATFDPDGQPLESIIDDGTQVTGLLVFGDGRVLVSDDSSDALRFYSTDGSAPTLLAALNRPRQIAYLLNGNIAATQYVLGDPVLELDLETGIAETTIRPVTPSTTSTCQPRGIIELGNGRWLMTGGGCADSFGVASVDPDGAVGDLNRQGMIQHLPDSIYDDEEPSDGMSDYPNNYGFFGRACLPNGVIDPVP